MICKLCEKRWTTDIEICNSVFDGIMFSDGNLDKPQISFLIT